MRKTIRGKRYDTDTSKILAYWESGDTRVATWYEETLYQKRGGEYFLLGNGYSASPYADRTIKPLTLDEAKEWGRAKLSQDDFDEIFNVRGGSSKVTTTISISEIAYNLAKRNSTRIGVNVSQYIESLILNGIKEENKYVPEGDDLYCITKYTHFTPLEKRIISESSAKLGTEFIDEGDAIYVKAIMIPFPTE